MSLLKIFVVLFFPVFFWAGYSFSSFTWSIFDHEIPKMEKIELVSYSLDTNTTKIDQKSSKIIDQEDDQNTTLEALDDKIKVTSIVSSSDDHTVDQAIDQNSSENELSQKTPQILSSHTPHKMIPVDLKNSANEDNQTKLFKIVVIGDSMGEGIAIGLARLKQKYPIKYKSFAKSSTTTFFWNKELIQNQEIAKFNPDLVLVALGTNEWNGVSSGTKLRIMKIYNKLTTLGIQSIWITPPVGNATKFYEMVREVYGDQLYDARGLNVPRGPDKIHPTMKGYVTWADDILQAVQIGKN